MLVDALATHGVRHLFTVSGNHVLSIFDATIGRGAVVTATVTNLKRLAKLLAPGRRLVPQAT